MVNYESAPDRTCIRCGANVPAAKIVQTARLRDRTKPIPDWAVACSTECAQRHSVEQAARTTRCAMCPKIVRKADSISEPARPGRRRIYCSEQCKRARERQLARGWRIIGKGVAGLPKSPNDHATSEAWAEHTKRLRRIDADINAVTATNRETGNRPDGTVSASLGRIRRALVDRITEADIRTRRRHGEERAQELSRKAAEAAKAGRLDRAYRLSRAVTDALSSLPELPDADVELTA